MSKAAKKNSTPAQSVATLAAMMRGRNPDARLIVACDRYLEIYSEAAAIPRSDKAAHDLWASRTYAETMGLIAEIESTPAVTPLGRRAKAAAAFHVGQLLAGPIYGIVRSALRDMMDAP